MIMFFRRLASMIFIYIVYVGLTCTATSSQHVEERNSETNRVKIAIVGGGIGGTSSAFYLQDLFGQSANITLFEKDAIGGRLATVFIAGAEYEIGGTIIHPRNLYMKKFVKDFGLAERKKSSVRTMGIYDGEEIIFQTSSYSIITLLKMLWRYGFEVFKMNWTIESLLKKFERMYDFQDAGQSYTTIEGIMDAMGEGDFVSWLSKPISQVLSEMGYSERFISELLATATRANYGQDPDMMGFAGMVSLAGAMPGLWSVEGGNKRVPEELLRRSGATLTQSRVRSIERIKEATNEKPRFRITWAESNSEEFDAVVIATPLQDGLSGIAFSGFDQPITNFTGDYRHTVASLIQGHPRSTTFGVSSKATLPGQIITNKDIPMNLRTLAKNFPVDFDPNHFNESKQIYKVFSTGVLNETQMGALFDSQSVAVHRDWLAYPYYRPRTSPFPGFVLSDGVFYPNAIEWAASAMEMGIIGGRNSAILTYEYLTRKSATQKLGSSRVKQEL